MSKLILIDGNSLINRAFYSMPPLSNKKGEYTNAVYGFINMLVKLITDINPSYIATAFDLKGPTFRHKMYPEYKANRKGMPDELASQLPILKTVLSAMDIKIFECEGVEADDIIGTVCNAYKNNDSLEILVLTADKDMLQLIDKNVTVLLTKKGITELHAVDEKVLKDEFFLTPKQVIDYKALLGDVSDNIPGVLGVGEKTAHDLILKFQSLESIYKNLESISGKLKEKLEQGKESAYLSQKLASINCGCHICDDIDLEKLRLVFPLNKSAYDVFEEYEFKTLLNKTNLFKDEYVKPASVLPAVKIEKIENLEGLKKLCELLKTKKQIAINIFADKINVAYDEKNEFVINLSDTFLPDVLNAASCVGALFAILKDDGIEKIVFDAKVISGFLRPFEAEIDGVKYDISIMKYLTGDNLKDSLQDVIYSEGLNSETLAAGMFVLKNTFLEKLRKFDALKIYDIELKLFKVLLDMEKTGFKIDAVELENFEKNYSKILSDLTDEIYNLADCKFNLNSPKQISEILFPKLNLKSGKKNKTGFSTDIEVLESLAGGHEVIGKLIKYRQFSKLYNTYIIGLKNVMDKKTNLVHTVFKQTLTSTGRLSSIEPNLQNIPVRDEEGLKIRKLFIKSGAGRKLIAADYSQIELRLLAHFSGDEKLIDAFSKNLDIHTITASQVFNLEPKNVTAKMRREAKAVNFGIIYGISDFGLAKQLECPVSVAKNYIKKYFETYPKIKEYLNGNVEFAKKNGYSKTMFNRIRVIKDINSTNYNLRSFSERAAMNMPLQGTAADILKIAMVGIYENFQKKNMKSKMILSVHDEIIIDAEISEMTIVENILKDCMENAVKLTVPLTVSVKKGDSWYDAE